MIARRHVLVAAGAALALLTSEQRVRAAQPQWGTVPKAALNYRDHPLGEKSCATCGHFLPGATPSQADHCSVVAGVVQPTGYCLAWLDRNPSNTC